jgi:purine-binding chemotaxis protein CheW
METQREAPAPASAAATTKVLVTRLGGRRVALPLVHALETMRPLPIEPVAGAAPFVRGLCRIRGAAVPVLDGGLLVGDTPAAATRLVLLRVAGRVLALAVDAVVGVATLDAGALAATPPLLHAEAERVEAIGVLDAELLLVLRTSRLVPDELWARLEAPAR